MAARSSYHHGDLRAALIRAALDSIAENGIGALSVVDTARRTGVTKTAPYRHFPSRRALLAATATAAARLLAADLRAALGHPGGHPGSPGSDSPAGPAEALAVAAAVYVRFLVRRGAAFDLIYADELADLDDRELAMAGRDVMDLLLPIALDLTGQDAPTALNLLERCIAAAHGYGALQRSGFLRRRSGDVEVHASNAAVIARTLAAAASPAGR